MQTSASSAPIRIWLLLGFSSLLAWVLVFQPIGCGERDNDRGSWAEQCCACVLKYACNVTAFDFAHCVSYCYGPLSYQ